VLGNKPESPWPEGYDNGAANAKQLSVKLYCVEIPFLARGDLSVIRARGGKVWLRQRMA
jgi:hypothetical protein